MKRNEMDRLEKKPNTENAAKLFWKSVKKVFNFGCVEVYNSIEGIDRE